ncbi:MAG: flippase [Candidatus Margulisiibacteriota bacterium]
MKEKATGRIARNFSSLVFGDLVSRGLNFFALIYLARVLGAAAFGLLNYAQAFQAYLILLVDSGLSLFGTREIARQREQAAVISLNIFAIRLVIAAVVFAGAVAVLFLLPMAPEMRWLFIGSFLFLFARALNADWVFQGLERMDLIAVGKIATSLLLFGLIIFLVHSSRELVVVPFITAGVGSAVALVLIVLLFRRFTRTSQPRLSLATWWDYLLEALPLGASAIMIQIYYNLDTIMLGLMDKPEVVGYYNAAYKLFFIVLGFLMLWQSAAFPLVSHRFANDRAAVKRFLEKYARLSLLAFLPLTTLFCLLAPQLVKLFYGAAYAPAIVPLQILIWNVVAIIYSGMFGTLVMVPMGRGKEFLLGVAAGAFANLVLNLILIPPLSMIGASWATLLTELLVGGIMIYFTYRQIYIDVLNRCWVPVVATAGGLAAFLLVTAFWPALPGVILAAAAFGVVYALELFAFGEVPFLAGFVTELIGEKHAS